MVIDGKKWSFAAALLLAAICLLAVGGCGGGGDATTPADNEMIGTPPMKASKAERKAYIAEVDPTCARYNRMVRKINRKVGRITKRVRKDGLKAMLAAMAPALATTTEIAKQAQQDFNQVKPPSGDEQFISDFDYLSTRQITMLELIATAADRTNASTFKTVSDQIELVVDKRVELAKEYGFEYCGFGA